MKQLIKIRYVVIAFLFIPVISACNGDKDIINVELPTFTITTTDGEKAPVELHVPAIAGSETFSITSNGNWEVTKHGSDTDWISITPEDGRNGGELIVTVAQNTGQEPRKVTLRFAVNSLQTNALTIMQLGYAPSIAVLPQLEEPYAVDGGDITFTVTTNDDAWEYSLPAGIDWLVEKEKTANALTLTVLKNAGNVLPILPRSANIKFSLVNYPNVSELIEFSQEGKELKLDGYKIKRYGTKTWMIENLKERGANEDLGAVYNNDPAMEALYGRYYTWHEAMTGIPNATAADNPYVWGVSGIDDAGNPYTLDGTTASHNIQIQGACPEGWHVANMNDWYDLLVAIKEEYNIPGNSIAELQSLKSGYIVPWSREEAIKESITVANSGMVAPYLKGSRPQSEGGLWQGGSSYNYGGAWGTLPLFMDFSDEVEFNILPSGRWSYSNGTWNAEGQWSYHFVAYLKQDDRPLRVTAAYNNANFSNGVVSAEDRGSCRCVANY